MADTHVYNWYAINSFPTREYMESAVLVSYCLVVLVICFTGARSSRLPLLSNFDYDFDDSCSLHTSFEVAVTHGVKDAYISRVIELYGKNSKDLAYLQISSERPTLRATVGPARSVFIAQPRNVIVQTFRDPSFETYMRQVRKTLKLHPNCMLSCSQILRASNGRFKRAITMVPYRALEYLAIKDVDGESGITCLVNCLMARESGPGSSSQERSRIPIVSERSTAIVRPEHCESLVLVQAADGSIALVPKAITAGCFHNSEMSAIDFARSNYESLHVLDMENLENGLYDVHYVLHPKPVTFQDCERVSFSLFDSISFEDGGVLAYKTKRSMDVLVRLKVLGVWAQEPMAYNPSEVPSLVSNNPGFDDGIQTSPTSPVSGVQAGNATDNADSKDIVLNSSGQLCDTVLKESGDVEPSIPSTAQGSVPKVPTCSVPVESKVAKSVRAEGHEPKGSRYSGLGFLTLIVVSIFCFLLLSFIGIVVFYRMRLRHARLAVSETGANSLLE